MSGLANNLLGNNVFFGVAVSVGAYFVGVYLKKRFNNPIFNPLLVAIVLVVVSLKVFRVDYAKYESGAKYLSYLLTPATICLAIPLYRQFDLLKKNWKAILAGILAGTLTNFLLVYAASLIFGLDHRAYATFLSKSITTAIGMGVTEELGGNVAVAVVAIILTGISGNIFGEKILRLCRITKPLARGLALGTSSHAIGTSKAMELGETEGASSGLAIVVTGLLTVLLAPLFSRLLN